MPQAPSARSLYAQYGVLLAILLVAGVLRIVYLTKAPPGLNQDEAANAWNAWCLLKIGHDQVGAGWPIFYFRELGGNRSALYLYTMLPFQLIGGCNVWTTRLPSAVAGILTVLLTYWLGARLFNRPAGLVAAFLVALSPWNIALSRWGHEAAIGPLVVALALAAWLWAGLPLRDGEVRPVVWRALVAGLLTGVACYGYAAVRLFLPPFVAACVLVNWRAWWALLRTRRDVLSLVALLVGLAATIGPLGYEHIAHGKELAKRAEFLWLWQPDDPVSVRVTKVLARYADHFTPDSLFGGGDRSEIHMPAGYGMYHWYALPPMLVGLGVMFRNLWKSRAARVLLCWVILYPAGDCLYPGMPYPAADGSMHNSMHMLRSAPGLIAPALLAAVGAAAVGLWIWRRSRAGCIAAVVVAVLAVVPFDVLFCRYYFGPHTRRPFVFYHYHVALVEACEWLRPRLDQVDAVVVGSARTNSPYIVMMVALGYDPQRWFEGERTIRATPEWDRYVRVGKFYYYYDKEDLAQLEALRADGQPHRVLFMVRPGELQLSNPVHTICAPDGRPAWFIYDVQL